MNFHKFLKIQDIRFWLLVDFVVQSTLLILTLAAVIFSMTQPGMQALVLLVQLVLGIWQLAGSLIITVLSKATSRRLHLKYSALYLGLLVIATALPGSGADGLGLPHNYWADALIHFLSGVISLYCYFKTWELTFPRKVNSSRFLPHINF